MEWADNFTGLQHIGIPTNDMDKTVEFYKKIGSNVARIRKKHKLSQLKLSLLIGHKSTSLLAGAEIYYNKQHFSLEHLANISFVLNEDITEFFK